ncbi:cobalt-precorrin 5A hydrolase [Paraburkholderia sartisoli]|uniref:Cobalt-precorrin 5A hydrolase n=2 Tax=Paraburkholderia sartisoli TaxID=83784 RepID=A0A1H4HIY9_9BURK|nr:cobalt-precorrin 5A hydrolase [Paraburkholderia sartisoli]
MRGATIAIAKRLIRGGRNEAPDVWQRMIHLFPETVMTTASRFSLPDRHSMKTLTIGIGCRRNVSVRQVESAVRAALALAGRSLDDVLAVATLESKAHEPGIAGFCAHHTLALHTFSAEQIDARGELPTPSGTVRAKLGIDGVCEPCALLALPGAMLIVPKTVLDGVTVAIASAP